MFSAQTIAATRGMERAEWLELRRKGIGGSDAAAIMGANPYASPLSVYMDKLGIAPDKEQTEAMRQGSDFEAYVAERFCESTGKKVRRCNKILRHSDNEWMLANVDRMIVGENAGLECKTTSVYNNADFERGEVPLTYQWQCQHYMAVTGAYRWYLAVLVLNKAFYVYQIDRDENLIETLIERERDFWFNNVLNRVPPLPIGSDADDEALETLYNVENDAAADLSSVRDILDLLELKRADMARLDVEMKELQQQVKAALGECSEGNAGNWRVTWRNQESNRIDTKALRKDHPDIAQKYTKTSTTRVFRIKKMEE